MKAMAISLALILLFKSHPIHSFNHAVKQEIEAWSNEQFTGDCAFKVHEYEPALKWNNLRYMKNYESSTEGLIRGKKIGEVLFQVNGNVCLGYRLKNGDATWAPIGTEIYEVKGYSEKFRIWVGDELYEVFEVPHPQKIGDFYDVTGKVKKITLEYPIENSPAVEFSSEATRQFVEEYLQLDYVPFKEIYAGLPHDSSNYFLRFHLHDNSSFIVSYWPVENAFTRGYGNDKIKKLIMSHAEKLMKLAPDPAQN